MFYKSNKESIKNKNVNNDRHNVFTDDTEIDVEQEEDAVKNFTNENFNNEGEEVNKKNKKRTSTS